MNITGLLGSFVAYSGDLARACGGVNAAIFASHIAFRSNGRADGWVQLTQEEIEAATALSVDAQRSARKALKACCVLLEREERLAHRMYYRLDEAVLRRLLDPISEQSEVPISGSGESPLRGVEEVHSVPSKENGKEQRFALLPTLAPPEPAIPLGIPDPPEWLRTLRTAKGYNLWARELDLINFTNGLGVTWNSLNGTAESLVSQWPSKKYKDLFLTFKAWLRREKERNGIAQGPARGAEVLRRLDPTDQAKYIAAGAKWNKPVPVGVPDVRDDRAASD